MRKILILVTTFILACSFLACGNKNQEVGQESTLNTSQMKAVCELATLECYYHNVAKYDDKDVEGALFWKKDKKFWIRYSGIVKIGIDTSKLEIEIEEDVVTIHMPEAKVLSVKVDEESLTEDSFIVDKKSAKVLAEDQTKAYQEAQDKMMSSASGDAALLGNAKQRAQTLLEDCIKNIGDKVGKSYTIKFVDVKDEASVNEAEVSETEVTEE